MTNFFQIYMWLQSHYTTIFAYLNGFTLAFSVSIVWEISLMISSAKRTRTTTRLDDTIYLGVASVAAVTSFVLMFIVESYVHLFIDTVVVCELLYNAYMLASINSLSRPPHDKNHTLT